MRKWRYDYPTGCAQPDRVGAGTFACESWGDGGGQARGAHDLTGYLNGYRSDTPHGIRARLPPISDWCESDRERPDTAPFQPSGP